MKQKKSDPTISQSKPKYDRSSTIFHAHAFFPLFDRVSRRISMEQREELTFYLLISPWIVGFVAFFIGPMLVSLFISFSTWDLLQPPQWSGFNNYVTLLTKAPVFLLSLRITLVYTVGSVLLLTTGSLFLALLLNQHIPGLNLYRTIYYLPMVISGVAVAQIWNMILNPDIGLLNTGLRLLGLRGVGWLTDPDWALSSLILISLWGVGGGIIIFLAALQTIPRHLYEAAELDGAGTLGRFWHITLPMLSPAILFLVVINTLSSFQVFTTVKVLTDGGPANATLVIVMYLYRNAFEFLKMGYASAMAWILFLLMLTVTLVQLRLSRRLVHYGAE